MLVEREISDQPFQPAIFFFYLSEAPQLARARLGDVPALFGRHVPLARQMLRKLLDGYIRCEPIVEGGKPGYRFTATGTFDRLLAGMRVVNDGGGGQGS